MGTTIIVQACASSKSSNSGRFVELIVIGWVSASEGSCADCTDMGVARAGLTACIGFVSPILGFFGAGLRIGGDISFAGVAKGFGGGVAEIDAFF